MAEEARPSQLISVFGGPKITLEPRRRAIMMRIVGWSLSCVLLAPSVVAQHRDETSLDSDTPISTDSENAYEFRGNTSFTYEPYEALFEARTYGELQSALEEFFRRWKEDGRVFEDSSSRNIFFRCRLALIRTYYLLGETEKADALLGWTHPAFQLDETGFPPTR